MAIGEGIAAVTSGFEIAKSVRELVKKQTIDPNEVSSQLLLLQQVMLDSQKALNDADAEIRKLQTQLSDVNRLDEVEKDLEWVTDGSFWIRKSEIGEREIKYCPQCWGDSKRLMPLHLLNPHGCYRCDPHKTVYETEAHKEYQRRSSQVLVSRGGPDSWMG